MVFGFYELPLLECLPEASESHYWYLTGTLQPWLTVSLPVCSGPSANHSKRCSRQKVRLANHPYGEPCWDQPCACMTVPEGSWMESCFVCQSDHKWPKQNSSTGGRLKTTWHFRTCVQSHSCFHSTSFLTAQIVWCLYHVARIAWTTFHKIPTPRKQFTLVDNPFGFLTLIFSFFLSFFFLSFFLYFGNFPSFEFFSRVWLDVMSI